MNTRNTPLPGAEGGGEGWGGVPFARTLTRLRLPLKEPQNMDIHPIGPEKRQAVLAALEQIERQHDVRVLMACESGSRGWGDSRRRTATTMPASSTSIAPLGT